MYYFIGIKGSGMAPLAEILHELGNDVCGSDIDKYIFIEEELKKRNIPIYSFDADNIKDGYTVIIGNAFSDDHVEVKAALANPTVKCYRYFEFLGKFMENFISISIAGTHGKTTTTSMLSHITLSADLDPTILVGGDVDAIHGNFKIGESEYFVTEACEYKASFLKFFPYIGIILNIDADHLDYYRDINHIEDTFKKFSDLIPSDGYLVGCTEDSRVEEVLKYAKCNTISYGFTKGDVTATNISFNNKGCASFTVCKNGKSLFDVTLNTTGKHNILNALSAICTSLILNIPTEAIIEGLANCKGAHKRFEFKGEFKGATIIDDYAHHPVEIKATLATAKLIKHNKTYCVFQPHTYTRTKTLFDEFTTCFASADELILMDIYAAREKDTGLVSSEELGNAIRKTGLNCINVHSHEEAANYLASKVESGDLVLTVGAGDVVKVGEMLLNK